MPAATSAPNATIMIASVIGSESSSAWVKSSPILSSTAFELLASPSSSIVNPGLARCPAATESRIGPILSVASAASPSMSS